MMFPTIWYPKGLLKRILEVTLSPPSSPDQKENQTCAQKIKKFCKSVYFLQFCYYLYFQYLNNFKLLLGMEKLPTLTFVRSVLYFWESFFPFSVFLLDGGWKNFRNPSRILKEEYKQ